MTLTESRSFPIMRVPWLALLLGVIGVIAVGVMGSSLLGNAQCDARWAHLYPIRYSLLGGCQVEVLAGVYVPTSAIRIAVGK